MYKEAARAVADLGYKNVRVFPDGIPGWKAQGYDLIEGDTPWDGPIKSIPADALEELLGQVTLLDIRTPELYRIGSIAGSIHIPMARLTEQIDEVPRHQRLVVIDHKVKQAPLAVRYLKSEGFDDVRYLEDGMITWIIKGHPVEK